MDVALMAGGEGTRLRPLTLGTPKPLAPVCNRPIMEHIIELCAGQGFRNIHGTLHYLADEIIARFGDGADLGVKLSWTVEEDLLGTAGSVRNIDCDFKETFMILSGDAIMDLPLKKAVQWHKKHKALVTIVLARVPTPLEYGVVITDEKGRIVRFLEKPGWGEVFSDTVNTGIYILEPEVLDRMEKGKSYDWSKDIFPAILEEGGPMYGCALPGYWCDVGSLKAYRETHDDVLDGKLKLNLCAHRTNGDVRIGKDCVIHPSARIVGPSLIGDRCRIEANAVVGPYSVLGDNAAVGEKSRFARSLAWENVYLGKNSDVVGSILCRNVIVEEGCRLQEGAIVGDDCTLGAHTKIASQVKLWPGKIIGSGSQINMSVIWGENWPGALFSALGVRGLANRQITPEFAARLGSAFGACLPEGSAVVCSRSPHKIARVIKRSLVGGLMSVGVNTLDVRTLPLPVTRHCVGAVGAAGGVHVRLSPYQPEMALIEFFDPGGINIDTNFERKIENVFFRQDFRRTDAAHVGELQTDTRQIDRYLQRVSDYIDREAIKKRRFRVVADFSNGSLALLLPQMLGRLRCDVVSLNAYMSPDISPRASTLDREGLVQLGRTVKNLKADFGILVDGESEKIALADGRGKTIAGDRLLSLMIRLTGLEGKKRVTALQVRSPLDAWRAACRNGGGVAWVKSNSRSLMREIRDNGEVAFGGDTKGGFVFPDFQPAFDGMVTFLKVMELLARYDADLADLNRQTPDIFIAEQTIPCPWDRKGELMRALAARFEKKKPELIDGIKVIGKEGIWALVRPDPAEPTVHIIAEGRDRGEAAKILLKYKEASERVING